MKNKDISVDRVLYHNAGIEDQAVEADRDVKRCSVRGSTHSTDCLNCCLTLNNTPINTLTPATADLQPASSPPVSRAEENQSERSVEEAVTGGMYWLGDLNHQQS